MNVPDVEAALALTGRLFPAAVKYWTPDEWRLLRDAFAGFKGEYKQAAAVMDAHRAETSKSKPTIAEVRRRLKSCEPLGPVASNPAGPPDDSMTPSPFILEVAWLAIHQPKHPLVRKASAAAKRCPEFLALMKRARAFVESDPRWSSAKPPAQEEAA